MAAAEESVPAEEYTPDKTYVYGWSFAPASNIPDRLSKHHPVDMSDAAHMHSTGTLFTTVCLDADRRVVELLYTCLNDTERTETWDVHNESLAKAYTKEAFNTSKRRRIGDGDKGMLASTRFYFREAKDFYCLKHRSANIGEKLKSKVQHSSGLRAKSPGPNPASVSSV